MTFARALALLAVTASVAVASVHQRTDSLSERTTYCEEGFFFWSVRSICLTIGGTAAPSYPPGGKACPSEWQYHSSYSCCVPTHPNAPTPYNGDSCSNGWPWSFNDLCCNEPTARAPTPSGRVHYGRKKLTRAAKRDMRKMDCPAGLKACSIGLHMGEWECVDPLHDLTSCGGCVAPGDVGQDCTSIVGADAVRCNVGLCEIFECLAGFELSPNGGSCIKL